VKLYTSGKKETECKIIEDQLKEQALALYIKGFIKPIKVMLKARNPTTIEEAKGIAMCEELEFNSEKETNNLLNDNKRYNNNSLRTNNTNNNYNNRPNPNNNRFNNYNNKNAYQSNMNNNYNNYNNRDNKQIKCYKCNGPHFANQCRTNQVQRSNYRPPNNNFNRSNNNNNYNYRQPNINQSNNNNNQRNNYTRPPTNYNTNTQGISCNYCNRGGHDISNCYKKKNDERNNFNSGNDRSDAARGPRTVNQIQTAEEGEETYNVASTSYQQ